MTFWRAPESAKACWRGDGFAASQRRPKGGSSGGRPSATIGSGDRAGKRTCPDIRGILRRPPLHGNAPLQLRPCSSSSQTVDTSPRTSPRTMPRTSFNLDRVQRWSDACKICASESLLVIFFRSSSSEGSIHLQFSQFYMPAPRSIGFQNKSVRRSSYAQLLTLLSLLELERMFFEPLITNDCTDRARRVC